MGTAGYSGTPLFRKLGIREGARVLAAGAPADFVGHTLQPLPEGVTLATGLRGSRPFDVIVLFADRRSRLEREFPRHARRLTTAGGLWVAWPKKSSGVSTDVGESDVRGFGLAQGLVDNKICAIDEVWSGLRFVYRLKDRPKRTAGTGG